MGIEVFVSPEKEEEKRFEEMRESEKNIELNIKCMEMAFSIASARGDISEEIVFNLAKRIKEQITSSM